MAVLVRRGAARRGLSCSGVAGSGEAVSVRQGTVWRGLVGSSGEVVGVCQGVARLGVAGQSRLGPARCGGLAVPASELGTSAEGSALCLICEFNLSVQRFPSGTARRIRTVASADEICLLLARFRFSFAHEDDLQRGIAGALRSLGLVVRREVRLGAAGRIDLLVERVGIEVKVKGKSSRVEEQLRRYALRDELDELLLITTRARHRPPAELCGKPVRVFRVT